MMTEPGGDQRWIPLVQDDEVGAMAKLVDALDSLDPAARCRVLEWAQERYGKTMKIIAGLTEALVEAKQSSGGQADVE